MAGGAVAIGVPLAAPVAAVGGLFTWLGARSTRSLRVVQLNNLAFYCLTRGELDAAEALLARADGRARGYVLRAIRLQQALVALSKGEPARAVAAATDAATIHVPAHAGARAPGGGLCPVDPRGRPRGARPIPPRPRWTRRPRLRPPRRARRPSAARRWRAWSSPRAPMTSIASRSSSESGRATATLLPRERVLVRAFRRDHRRGGGSVYRRQGRRHEPAGEGALRAWASAMAPAAAGFVDGTGAGESAGGEVPLEAPSREAHEALERDQGARGARRARRRAGSSHRRPRGGLGGARRGRLRVPRDPRSRRPRGTRRIGGRASDEPRVVLRRRALQPGRARDGRPRRRPPPAQRLGGRAAPGGGHPSRREGGPRRGGGRLPRAPRRRAEPDDEGERPPRAGRRGRGARELRRGPPRGRPGHRGSSRDRRRGAPPPATSSCPSCTARAPGSSRAPGRTDEANAELALVARDFPNYPFATRTRHRVRLVAAVTAGDLDAARDLVRRRAPEMPLRCVTSCSAIPRSRRPTPRLPRANVSGSRRTSARMRGSRRGLPPSRAPPRRRPRGRPLGAPRRGGRGRSRGGGRERARRRASARGVISS